MDTPRPDVAVVAADAEALLVAVRAEPTVVARDELVAFDEVRAVQRITDLLLKAGEKKPLTDLQRLIVTQAHNKCQQILDRGTFNADDRKWLIRISQLLLLSVF